MKRRNTFVIHNTYLLLVYRIALVYLLYFIMRILFILFNLHFFHFDSFAQLRLIYIGSLRFDTTAILYTNLIVIILSLLPFKFRYKKGYQQVIAGFYYVLNSLSIIANMCDVIYYRFTLRRTTMMVFDEFANDSIGKLFFKFSIDYWYITLTSIALIALMIWGYRRAIPPEKSLLRGNALFYTFSSLLLALNIVICVAGIRGGFAHSTRPITLSNATLYVTNSTHTSIVLNTPFSLIRTIGKNNLQYKKYFTPKQLSSYFNPVHLPIAQQDSLTGKYKGYNVVLIIVESLGKEVMGSLNKEIEGYKGYTPFLDSLATQSTLFGNCFSNGRKSIDALPSILTSIPSLGIPFILTPYSCNNINTLASLLGEEGYETAFYHGAPNGSMGFDAFAKQARFNHYFGKTEYANNKDYDGIWGIWDEPFLQYFAHSMTQLKEPFHTTIFTLSSHHPFKVPTAYEGRFKKGTSPLHECMQYADYSLSRFFATASKQPWYANTIFVIVGDHASQNQMPQYNTAIGQFATPLFFYIPGNPLIVADNTTVAQQCDILPTILDLLGYEKPFVSFGNSLFNPQQPHFSLSYNEIYQLVEGKYLLQFDDEKAKALYQYDTDHLLNNNLLGKTPQIESQLTNRLKAIIQEYNARMIDNRLTATPTQQ